MKHTRKKYKIEIDHKKRQKTLDKTKDAQYLNIFIMGKKPELWNLQQIH